MGKEYKMNRYKKFRIKRNLKTPWLRFAYAIKSRCININKPYYQKGIKCFLVPNDIKYLWFRDKAYEMKQPSIDRINTIGDYTIENTRFIELNKNLSRPRTKSKTVNNRFKGVYWQQDHNKWRVRITKGKKDIHIGYFSDEKEAAEIYNSIISGIFNKDSVLNKVL